MTVKIAGSYRKVLVTFHQLKLTINTKNLKYHPSQTSNNCHTLLNAQTTIFFLKKNQLIIFDFHLIFHLCYISFYYYYYCFYYWTTITSKYIHQFTWYIDSTNWTKMIHISITTCWLKRKLETKKKKKKLHQNLAKCYQTAVLMRLVLLLLFIVETKNNEKNGFLLVSS